MWMGRSGFRRIPTPITNPQPWRACLPDMRDDRRHGPVKQQDQRPAGASDRDRILHCSALRRLAGVTQVVAPEEGHVFHNRLTHSMKVGQIGRRLAEHVRAQFPDIVEARGGVDPEVVEAAGFAHDLGHPPFGHVTEKELNKLCQRERLFAGYEGNAQSFRILTKLAVRSVNYTGLNLCKATLNAVLKYPWLHSTTGDHSKKWGAYPEEEQDFKFAREGLGAGELTLEAELMNFADDVAYSIHDAEDFYRAGLIPMELLVSGSVEIDRVIERIVKRTGHSQSELQLAWDSAAPFAIEDRYLGTSAQRAALREWTSQMIQRYVQAVKFDAQNRLSVHTKIRREIEVLKGLTWEYVIESPMLATQQMGHRKVINGLFDAYLDASVNHTSVLPPRFRDYLQREQLHDQIYDSLTPDQRRVRTVADIIASMTDIEALRMYRRLHGFLPGSLSDAQLM
jgi:dGTPase